MLLFFSLFFSGCLHRVRKLTSHFFVPFSQTLPASRQARQICYVSEEYPPLCWAAAGSQVSPFRCSSHLSSEYSPVYYFFCMQDTVPTRPKQACISVDKYNMQDFFWNVLFFERFFLIFFANYCCENSAYYLQLIHLNAI